MTAPAAAAPGATARLDERVVQAREALRRQDKAALAEAARTLAAAGHPLAQWAEYWELSHRLADAQQPELTAFFTRWAGTYVEDRLRNDWLLELGKRRDWVNFRLEQPRFRFADDREVHCYALLMQHQDGQDVRQAARTAWYATRDLDDGCSLLARTLAQARVFTAADLWQEVRLSAEFNRPRPARFAAGLVSPAAERAVAELWDNPVKYLARSRHTDTQSGFELDLVALMRAASADPEFAAAQLEGGWATRLPATLAATAWAHVAKQAAIKLQPEAADHARRAWAWWDRTQGRNASPPPWSEDLLAWHVRAALREGGKDPDSWRLVQRALDAMTTPTPADQREGTWVYWRARAQLALAPAGPAGDAAREGARQALQGLSQVQGFYGQLAAADLGLPLHLPPAPAPLTAEERAVPRAHPGKARALHLIALGLRQEGVREWNYTLRGLGDRELLAAAQLACEREVWDRCINTSERTRQEVDLAQRFPLPYRDAIVARARAEGLDPALMLGLIRQESRFIVDTRSVVGASGLMQLMPATARWTARRAGLTDFRIEQVNDVPVNLHLGAAYLRHVLDDFGGSLAMATAAYNAGPSRPRRWREGVALEPAAWAESIPFNETRDYVKKVLSNTALYSALLGQPQGANLKLRLGPPIGPRDPAAPPPNRELP